MPYICCQKKHVLGTALEVVTKAHRSHRKKQELVATLVAAKAVDFVAENGISDNCGRHLSLISRHQKLDLATKPEAVVKVGRLVAKKNISEDCSCD